MRSLTSSQGPSISRHPFRDREKQKSNSTVDENVSEHVSEYVSTNSSHDVLAFEINATTPMPPKSPSPPIKKIDPTSVQGNEIKTTP